MYGLYDAEKLIGYVAVSKVNDIDDTYEIHHLSVVPEYRHKSYGKLLLDHCKAIVKELGGIRINIGIIEENTVLKNWYVENGFVHTGTKTFDFLPFTSGYMKYIV